MNQDSFLTSFKFEDRIDIRSFIDAEGNPHFCAMDVCEVLEIKDFSQAIARLDKDEVTVLDRESVISHLSETRVQEISSQLRKLTFVTESGLYELIFKSIKPAAKRFKKWITKEVIPSIRKQGYYSLGAGSSDPDYIRSVAQQHMVIANSLEKLDLRISAIEQRQEDAEKALLELPEPTIEVDEKPIRAMINERVRQYAFSTGIAYGMVWRNLYKEFYYRKHFNVNVRSKNSGIAKLDIIEKEGLMPDLYAIACDVLSIPEGGM